MCLHHIRVSYPAGTVVAAFARAPSAAGGPGHYRHGYRVTPGAGGGLAIRPTAWSALMVDIPSLEADPLHQITSQWSWPNHRSCTILWSEKKHRGFSHENMGIKWIQLVNACKCGLVMVDAWWLGRGLYKYIGDYPGFAQGDGLFSEWEIHHLDPLEGLL